MTAPTVLPAATELYRELAVAQPGDEARDWPLLKLLGAAATAFAPRLYGLVRDRADGRHGWTWLLDPDETEPWALPYLRQFAGVPTLAGLTEDQQRAQITAPPAFLRGTRKGMAAAIMPTLRNWVFRGDATEGSPVIDVTLGLEDVAPGHHVGGPAEIPAGAQILSVDRGAGTVTLDEPATADATDARIKTVRIFERYEGDPYRIAVAILEGLVPRLDLTAEAALSQKPIGLLLDVLYTSYEPLLMEYTRPLSAVTVPLEDATFADVT